MARLSEVMNDFVGALEGAGHEVHAAVLDGLKKGLTAVEGRKLADGTTVPRFEVDLSDLHTVAGAFRADARDLIKAIADEVKLRGENWALEGLHLAVKDLVIAPLEALAAKSAPAAAPAPAAPPAPTGEGA